MSAKKSLFFFLLLFSSTSWPSTFCPDLISRRNSDRCEDFYEGTYPGDDDLLLGENSPSHAGKREQVSGIRGNDLPGHVSQHQWTK